MYTYVINPIFLYFSVNILFWQTTKNGQDLNPFMPVVLYLGGIFLTNPSFKILGELLFRNEPRKFFQIFHLFNHQRYKQDFHGKLFNYRHEWVKTNCLYFMIPS